MTTIDTPPTTTNSRIDTADEDDEDDDDGGATEYALNSDEADEGGGDEGGGDEGDDGGGDELIVSMSVSFFLVTGSFPSSPRSGRVCSDSARESTDKGSSFVDGDETSSP